MARSQLPAASLHVLLALIEGDKHGYGIMRDVEVLSDGGITMGPGTLYGTLKRLVRDGLITEVTEEVTDDADDERRRYYRLTPEGRSTANAELARLATLLRRVRKWRPALEGGLG